MQARGDATLYLLKWMLASTIILPTMLFAYVAAVSYRQSFSLADERIERSLDVVAEHAAKTFQSLNVAITGVNGMIRGWSDNQIREAQEDIHQQLKAMAAELPAVGAIWIFDRDGYPLASSKLYPAPPGVNVSDRGYFLAHVNQDVGTFVGQVLVPRISDAPFFAVSRRRLASDGSFAGATVVSVLPADFHRFYERLARLKGSNYTMVRADGVVLSRYPGPLNPIVTLDASSGFMQSIARDPQGGYYTALSQVDASERRIAVRKLDGLPLYLSTGLGVSDIKAEWLEFLAGHLAFGLPATILLFSLVWVTLRRTKSLYAEAARRVAAEETLRQSQKMEVVGQLTGGIAHDFNNLLTIIVGNVEMALRKAVDTPLERLLRNSLVGAQRAAQLTQKLLAFARRQPLDPRPLDVNRLVAGMADLLKRSLGEQVDIETVGGAGLWWVEADIAELESAILNLAVNARDAMPQGGKLTVETSNAFLDEHYTRSLGDVSAGQYVLIAVSDTGTGMSPDVVERAFDPFFTTKGSGQGTGLGLSQVYGFVKQSGGHIKIYSEQGHGTTVKMYLPRHDAVETPHTTSLPSAEPGKGEIILVVEDDGGVRSYVGEILQELGYQVLVAAEGKAALALIGQAERHIDLLLTDVVLPGMNGRQIAEAAKACRPDLPVLFMTGYSRNAIVHQGRLDRGVALIQKPLSREALAHKISEVLGSGKRS